MLHTQHAIAEPSGDEVADPTDEIVPAMEQHGLKTVGLFGCESVTAGVGDRVNALEGEEWEAWVALCLRLAREPSLLGNSEHLLYIGRNRSGVVG